MAGVPQALHLSWWSDSKDVPFRPTKNNNNSMQGRFEVANITGLPVHVGVGRNVSEFSHFYCEHVKRVRKEVAKYPSPSRHELIEIDRRPDSGAANGGGVWC